MIANFFYSLQNLSSKFYFTYSKCPTFAWLTKLGTPEIAEDKGLESDAYAAAETAYEGGRYQTGEVAQSAYLSHQWPRFERLFFEQANGHTFATLVEALYAPLFFAVKGKKE